MLTISDILVNPSTVVESTNYKGSKKQKIEAYLLHNEKVRTSQKPEEAISLRKASESLLMGNWAAIVLVLGMVLTMLL